MLIFRNPLDMTSRPSVAIEPPIPMRKFSPVLFQTSKNQVLLYPDGILASHKYSSALQFTPLSEGNPIGNSSRC